MMKSFAGGAGRGELCRTWRSTTRCKSPRARRRRRAATPAAGKKPRPPRAPAATASTGVSSIPARRASPGRTRRYLVAATLAYKDGARKDETMKGLAAALDERAIKDIAAFYAAQQPQAPKVRKPLSLAEWTQRCDRCHGVNGNSIEPLIAGARGAARRLARAACSMPTAPARARARRWARCRRR